MYDVKIRFFANPLFLMPLGFINPLPIVKITEVNKITASMIASVLKDIRVLAGVDEV